jgi:hypothetical protein
MQKYKSGLALYKHMEMFVPICIILWWRPNTAKQYFQTHRGASQATL